MTTVEPIRKLAHLQKLEDYLLQKSMRDLLLFTIGINCGLRISDIVSLNVGDVRNKSHIRIVEQKTGKYKLFPINSKLKCMFKEFTRGKYSNEALFKTKFENRMDRFTAYWIIISACKLAGLPEKEGTQTMCKTFG